MHESVTVKDVFDLKLKETENYINNRVTTSKQIHQS